MTDLVRLEDIEDMRRRQGIDDVELHEQIRRLAVGDIVKLTLLASSPTSAVAETLSVRITNIRGGTFRGKLASAPVSRGLPKVRLGQPIAFTAAHIHSVSKPQTTRDK